MSDDILGALRQQFTPDTIQQMSSSLGTDAATTQNAIALALPALLGGLQRNASNPQGAAALDQALNAHDGGILGNLGGILGGAGGGGIGGAILGHIFGARRGPVEQGVGKATGMSAQQTAQLLAMLAPIVMAVLGRMKQQKGIDATQLPDVLNRTNTQIQKETPGAGGLASILDGNNDGSVMDDLGRMGSSVLGGLFKK